MMSLVSKSLIFFLPLLSVVYSIDLTAYDTKCVACIKNDTAANYYCTQSNQCVSTPIPNESCEQGMQVCMNYMATDLGVL